MDKFDFNTLPDYTSQIEVFDLTAKASISYIEENRKLKTRIKELEERILSLELDLGYIKE